jgi:N-acetylglucosamine kinase-like BadF-type ATPase
VPFFLGIDGGGTKTRCLLGNDSSLLGAGTGSGCNVLRVGEACARDSLAAAIHEACVNGGVSPKEISRTCAGISGAADDGIASLVQRLLIEIVGGAIEVLGDMEVAMEAAFGGGPGIIVIAGTGSIAYGRNARGEKARAGGWGRVVSDEGAGHWIAVRALAAGLRARDEGKNSELLQALMSALDIRAAEDLVVKLNEDPVRDYAPLFPVVLASAEAGDASAIKALKDAGAELAKLAQVLVKRLFGAEEVAIATHGGIFASSAVVKQSFEQHLHELSLLAKCIPGEFDPAMGALARAKRDFGVWHRQ